VAGGIISKLPPSWKDFATSLKHKRHEFTIDGLIGTLDVEEKVRAKDTRGIGVVGASANFVQKNNNFVQKNNSHRNKKKPPQTQNHTKTKQRTTFKKKKGNCYVCESPDHFAGKYPHRKGMKSANMVISEAGRTLGYGNSLPTVLLVFYLSECWVDTGANIHVRAYISLFFSYQVGGTASLLMGNGSNAHILGVGTVNLKFTSSKTVQLKNVQHVPPSRRI
jgi:hypothetical protein